MKADIIRQKYLDFFKAKQHKVVASDSLVPKEDPTLLFTTAGMNQFKMQFLGMVTDFRRATSSQRCLRTDDLDKVGKTDCHHTFFEMLGNFSFGDYFKKEAITWAWEFLIQELKLDPKRLWVTVYKDDPDAYDIWKNTVGFPEEKIVKLGDKDNFWPSEAKEKGPNGPCGPCSEIFIDLGADVGCKKPGCSPACSCGRFIEIWNLVFTQFNRKDGGILEPLPQKNIDTGMGLERVTAVMQGKTNNFETDLFQPVIKEIEKAAAGQKKRETVFAVADHLRAVSFAVLDGVMPSNEWRGYVIRKLIRTSVWHVWSMGIKRPFLYTLVPVLAEVMSVPYPELKKRQEDVAQVILSEEKNFISVLEKSDTLFEEHFAAFKSHPDPKQAGMLAFKMNDTYGIPFDLTRQWADHHGVTIDLAAFEQARNEQSKRSRQHSKMQGDVFGVKEAQLRSVTATKFTGYDRMQDTAKVVCLVNEQGDMVDQLAAGEKGSVMLDTTPFYAESGGQVGDCGELVFGSGSFVVTGTSKVEKVFLHAGQVGLSSPEPLKKGTTLTASVDATRRLRIMRNHTATHLLQAALRKVLGGHVQQQGSMVAPDRFRFDFSHFKALTDEELGRVEEMVNEFVVANAAVVKQEMAQEEAKHQGALAFFGDKYEDVVRVVSVEGISKEFCGGTHLDATGQIGSFKILSESSVASGVRRIEGVTGIEAYQYAKMFELAAVDTANMLKVPVEKLAEGVQKIQNKAKDLEKQLASAKSGSLKSVIDEAFSQSSEVKGVKVVAKTLGEVDINGLRQAVDQIKQKGASCAIALGSRVGPKAFLVVGLTQDLVSRGLDSSALVKEISRHIGGTGGGRKDFAQAGGDASAEVEKAVDSFKQVMEKAL